MGSSNDRMMTAQEVADYMSVGIRYVRRLTAERRIAFTRIGRHIRIRKSDVDAFLEAGKVEPELDAFTKMKVGQA